MIVHWILAKMMERYYVVITAAELNYCSYLCGLYLIVFKKEEDEMAYPTLLNSRSNITTGT
jgi:hypothetical protein